jgi:hypothetical protein
MNKQMSFTIAQNSIDSLQRKIELLESWETLFTSTPFNDASSPLLKRELQPVFKILVDSYASLKKKSQDKIKWMQKKQSLTQENDSLETQLDGYLGKLFWRLQNMRNGYRCFTKSELSYVFFALVKGNMVIKEKAFLESFLNNQPYLYAKEFIVFNYTIFAKDEFTQTQIEKDDFVLKLVDYRQQMQEELISTYINNWCFIMNVFKDYTEFGTTGSSLHVKKVKISTRLLSLLGMSIQKLLFLKKKDSIGKYFAKFAKEFVRMIPFIGNVPFLASIIGNILGHICDFVVKIIKRVFHNPKKVTRFFMTQMRNVYGELQKFKVIDLDYSKYILSVNDIQMEDQNGSTVDMKVQAYKIEGKYLKKMQTRNDLQNNADRIYIFNGKFNSISLNKLDYASVRKGL